MIWVHQQVCLGNVVVGFAEPLDRATALLALLATNRFVDLPLVLGSVIDDFLAPLDNTEIGLAEPLANRFKCGSRQNEPTPATNPTPVAIPLAASIPRPTPDTLA